MRKKWFGLLATATVLLVVFSAMAQEDNAEVEIPSELKWPRVIETPEAKIIIYQPQLEGFEDNRLSSRFAASVQGPKMEDPVFGAVWVEANMETHRDERMVKLVSIETVRSRFPNAKPENVEWFANVLKKEIPTWDITLSIDQIIAGLEMEQDRLKTEQDLDNSPPNIIYVQKPATLVLVDGAPILKEIENTELMAVINTPFPMVFRKQDKTYYLIGKETWYQAKEIDGEWQETKEPPADVAVLEREASEEGEGEEVINPNAVVFGATEPTEILSIDGDPELVPFSGNNIMYVENTTNDLLYEVDSGSYFLLLSGRWYVTKILKGPWAYVPPEKVPQSFTDIPRDSEKSDILASVPGTEEAHDAVLDAQIPETTAIKRSEAKLTVEYDGEPEFKKIEGTEIDYAINSATSVIRVKGKYYAVDNGVWFVSPSAKGPWVVADSVPSEVQEIPPSSPVNNIKYVYIYDSTPEVVYVGYTPGYTGCYVYHGVVVYGTGYYYRPWYRHYYYPRPVTYGFSVRYNPYYGWSFGVSFYHGPFSFHFGHGWGHPRYGGWWGPPRYRPPHYRPPHHRPPGHKPPGNRPPGNRPPGVKPPIAKPPGNRPPGVKPPIAKPPGNRPPGGGDRPSTLPAEGRPSTRPSDGGLYDRRPDLADRDKTRPGTGDAKPARPSTGDVKDRRPTGKPSTLPNNVYTDRDGNIYRRGESGWEQRQGNKWDKPSGSQPTTKPAQKPTRPSGSIQQPAQRPATQPAQRPSGSVQRPSQPTQRPSGSSRPSTSQKRPSSSQSWDNRRQSLDHQQSSRNRGNQRTQQYQQTRQRSSSSSRNTNRSGSSVRRRR